MDATNVSGGSPPTATPIPAVVRALAVVWALALACPVGRASTIDFLLPLPEGESYAIQELPYTEGGYVFTDVFGSTGYVTTAEYESEVLSFLEMGWGEGFPSEIVVTQEDDALFSVMSVDYSHFGAGRLQFTSSKGGTLFTPQAGSEGTLTFGSDPLWRGITTFTITGLRGAPAGDDFTDWDEANIWSMVLVPKSFRYSGETGLWSGTSNWVGGATPAGDDAEISFIGPGGVATNDLAPGTFGTLSSLTFSESAGAYTVGSVEPNDVAIGEGGIRNESSHVQTILDDLSFRNDATIDVGAAGMHFDGRVTVSTPSNVVVAGAGTTSMARVTGLGSLTHAGPGTLRLTSTTSGGQPSDPHFIDGLNVQAGTLEVGPATTIFVNGTMSLGPSIEALHVTLGAGAAGGQAALRVDGPALLNGTLKVSLEPDFTPAVGDRFGIVSAMELQGRFEAFEAPVISGTSFLGLNYRRARQAGAAGPTQGNLAEVITLEAPRALAGGHQTVKTAENLVLVVHGYNSNAGNVESLATALATHATRDVDVAVLDWSSYATGSKLYQSAAENGVNIGEALGDWLRERGLTGYRNVQLLGHSAGTWLVNSLAGKIKEHSPQTKIQMTLFDSYVPSGVFRQGGNDLTVADIGRSADFVEQYFHDGSLPWTQVIMPRAVNIDVTAQEPDGFSPIDNHSFPYVWYEESAIQLGNPRYAGLGFALSVVLTGSVPSQAGNFTPGRSLTLAADPDDPGIWDVVQQFFTLQPPLNPLTSTPVTTGDVVVDAIGATLRTNSPAMLTMLAEIDEPANGFRFDMAFQNEALGNLAVYLDGSLLAEWSNESFAGLTGSFDSGWISTGDLELGPHTLMFRLDNLTESQSILRIEDVTFGQLVFMPVPEPSTGVLTIGGGIIAVGLRRRARSRPA